MIQLLKAIGSVLFVWWALGFLFLGLGLLLRQAIAGAPKDGRQVFCCFWLGYAFTIMMLQIWHLFLPVDTRIGALLLLFSIMGFVANGRPLLRIIGRPTPADYVFLSSAILLAIFFAHCATGPPLAGDTGSYHLNSIRWVTACPIVPGLGNLHGRLAFNQTHFLYAGLLEACFWSERSFHFANSVLIVAFVVQILWAGRALLTNTRTWPSGHIFLIVTALPLYSLMHHLTSCSPDLPVFVMGILVCERLIDFSSNQVSDERELNFNLVFVAVTCALGVTLKVSFAVSAGIATFVAGYLRVRPMSRNKAAVANTAGLIALCWAVLMVPWMARGVVLSGWVAYPSTLAAVDVDWAVPQENVVQMQRIIKGWARMPGGTHWRTAVEGWTWILPWLRRLVGSWRNIIETVVPLTLSFLTLSCACFWFLTRRRWWTVSWWRYLILLPWVGGLLFWFFTAPDPRYSGSMSWILAAGLVTLAANNFAQRGMRRALRFGTVICLAVSVSLVMKGTLPLQGPGPDKGFHPAPNPVLKDYYTKSGLKLSVPSGTTVWYGPLVYTPWPDSKLRLREVSNLASGFATEKGGLILD